MQQAKKKRQGKYHNATVVGGIFAVLAIIGLITVIMVSVKATTQILDNSKEKEKFSQIILPVLMFDPVPFENAADLDPLFLLQSSLWATLQEKKDSYSYDDTGMMVVPATDVDVKCAQLFGDGVKLEHQTFGDFLISYVYDEQTEVYKVPTDAQVGVYTPEIEKISKKGDVYTLTVGYLPPGNSWAMDLSGKKYDPQPDKYMIYELKKVDNYFQLLSIKDPPEGAVPGVPNIDQNGNQGNNPSPNSIPDYAESNPEVTPEQQ